ncbi:hypothetical protein QTP70_001757 [Hemibagrus guttatus]|uniref:Uncharacterized protein n=1 Tax=Hemibagrus guttatus TaxID=175788 RepID=A0AAE0USB6_9TELE|nr:hypothetical protein QTP70_001757 [Hemibagrus guttatus]
MQTLTDCIATALKEHLSLILPEDQKSKRLYQAFDGANVMRAQTEARPQWDHRNSASLLDLCQASAAAFSALQGTRDGTFRREQKEDDWLKHCWGQVLQVEGVSRQALGSHSWCKLDKNPSWVVFYQRLYKFLEARHQAIEEEVEQMLRGGIIEESTSLWSSPIVVVPKPDGSLCLCNDFRRFNQISEFDSYPLPQVDDLMEQLGKARFVSTLDLTKGYWQVALAPRC